MKLQNIRFDVFLNTAPPTIVVQPDAPKFTIVNVSRSYLEITGIPLTNLVGFGLLEAFPANPHIEENGADQLKESLTEALVTKRETVLDARRYDIHVPGTNRWEARYWTATNSPILNEQGEVECIVHITQDVTTTYHLAQKKTLEFNIAEAQRKQLQEAYQQAPVGIGLLTGRDLRIDFGNDSILHVLGKTKDIIGKTVAEAIPELKGQPFLQILDKVYTSGETYFGNNQLVYFQQNGELKEGYYNFIYHPLKNNRDNSTGIMVIGMDVTKQVMIRKDLEKTIDLKNAVEEALRNNEARLQSILDTMAEGVSITDVKGNMVYANAVAQQMVEIKKDEKGNPVYDEKTWKNFRLDGTPLLWEDHPMNVALQTQKRVYNFEYGIELGNKEVTYISLNAAPLFNAEKEVTGAIGTFTNVTARRKLLNQLAENENLFRGLFEQAPLGMCLLRGREQIIEAVNDNILHIWGYKREDVIGLSQYVVRPELEGQDVLERIDAVFVTGETKRNTDFKVILRNFDGSPREAVVNSVYHPIKNGTGDVIGVMMITDEITDQYKATQQMKHTQEKFQQAVESAMLGTWYFNIATETFVPSQRVKEIFGYDVNDEMPYSDAIKQIDNGYRQTVLNVVRAAYQSKESFDVEFPITTLHTNNTRWLKLTGKVYSSSEDKPEQFSGIIFDITEPKLDDIRKNDFIAMVSHELKTPLTSMKGFLQMLQIQNEAENKNDNYLLQKADQQIVKMTNLINNFLNVSRLDAGKIHLDKTTFTINELIREVIDDMHITIRDHIVVFNSCKPVKIFADHEKIGQVINNFISNAVKYSHRGTQIVVDCTTVSNQVQVSVKDEGRGIAAEDKVHLFDRFFRVENKFNTTVAGFGIGLYVCHEIVRRHSGEIWVQSEVGKGSMFYFTLPAEENGN